MYFIHFYVSVTDAAPKCPGAESPASSWSCAELSRRRVGRAESAAPSCPIMCLHAHAYLRNHVFKLHQIFCACCLWLWLGRYYDTLCTSGFVDDAILAHQSQAYGDAKKACTDTQGGSQKASRIWHRGVEVYSNWLIRGNIAAGAQSGVSDCPAIADNSKPLRFYAC